MPFTLTGISIVRVTQDRSIYKCVSPAHICLPAILLLIISTEIILFPVRHDRKLSPIPRDPHIRPRCVKSVQELRMRMSVPVILSCRDQAQVRTDDVKELFGCRILRAMVGCLQHLELLSRPSQDLKQVFLPLPDYVPCKQAVEFSEA